MYLFKFCEFLVQSYLTIITTHSYPTHDAAASLREQLVEKTAEMEQLKKMNESLQQSQMSQQYEFDQLKQQYQTLLEGNKRNQVIKNSCIRSCGIMWYSGKYML